MSGFERSNYKVYCTHCADIGWVLAVHRTTHSIYGFRCGWCKSADFTGLSKHIPVWSSPYVSEHELYSKYMEREGWKS